MDRIETINLDRIRWCCDDRGITTDELAAELGISQGTLESLFAGEGGLTVAQLRKIAKYFGRGLLFFVEAGPVDEATLRTPQFRTIANQKPDLPFDARKLIERVEKQRDIYLHLHDDPDDPPLKRFAPPKVADKTPEAMAAAARKWLKLDGCRTFLDYRQKVEARGVLVFLGGGRRGSLWMPAEWPVAGFCLHHETTPVIVVRRHRYEARQTFTLMHELGHLLLHGRSYLDSEDDLYSHRGVEREANAFAGLVLMPDEDVAQISLERKPPEVSEYRGWLGPIADARGVSIEMVLRRLLDHRRIARKDYEAYRAYVNGLPEPEPQKVPRMYRDREPIHLFGDGYVRTVLDALHSQQITLNKASGFLDNLKVPTLHKLEAHLAGL